MKTITYNKFLINIQEQRNNSEYYLQFSNNALIDYYIDKECRAVILSNYNDIFKIIENDIILNIENLEKECNILYKEHSIFLHNLGISDNEKFDFENIICEIHVIPNQVIIFYPEEYNNEKYVNEECGSNINDSDFVSYPEILIKKLLE